ncbi:MAG: hypothetical protein CMP14_06990 [Rickettsiales bacterium]|jgi:predicted SAM-dependent methyltransferase|nr:hypothetical protein [Rickettsiales bacterium]
MKLNLGCGNHKIDNFINVDKFVHCEPDEVVDLESFPWPWIDNSADEVVMSHILEHLGQDTNVYFAIIKELYRVCCDGAEVRIAVPHPRHDDFLNDPTHVRAVTVEGLAMFSKKACDDFVIQKAANTPLAHILEVDFEMEDMKFTLEQPWLSKVQSGVMGDTELLLAIRQYNNVIKETSVKLRVHKN